ncbi:MAG: hypothetical protein ACRDYC_03640 [Acidimicrobiales bacterium]
MTESEPAPMGGEPAPMGDETQAFVRFYKEGSEPQPPRRGLLYRLLVGWWWDRPNGRQG